MPPTDPIKPPDILSKADLCKEDMHKIDYVINVMNAELKQMSFDSSLTFSISVIKKEK